MALKRLFVLGDSISLGYGPFLEHALQGWLEYDRKTGLHEALKDLDNPHGANGGDSKMCLDYLRDWKNRGGIPADILLLNCGLHDLKNPRDTPTNQIPLEAYRDHLLKMIRVIKDMNLKLIWVRTTPVNEQWHRAKKPFDRWEKEIEQYNSAADAIMKLAHVPVIDLFSFSRNIPDGLSEDGVHFTDQASKLQGAFIAGYLMSYLEPTTVVTETSAV